MRQQIKLPLPPRDCGPNYNPYAAKDRIRKAAAKRDYRAACCQAYRAGLQPMAGPVTLHLDLYLWRGKSPGEKYSRSGLYFPRDDDNALSAFKSGRDALRDAGIIPDDSNRIVTRSTATIHSNGKQGDPRYHQNCSCILLTIESAEPEELRLE